MHARYIPRTENVPQFDNDPASTVKCYANTIKPLTLCYVTHSRLLLYIWTCTCQIVPVLIYDLLMCDG